MQNQIIYVSRCLDSAVHVLRQLDRWWRKNTDQDKSLEIHPTDF